MFSLPPSLLFYFSYSFLSLVHTLLSAIPVMEILTDSSNVQIKTKLLTRKQVKQYFHSVETPSVVTSEHMTWV